jgi:predicted nuclease with RNAse H fold
MATGKPSLRTGIMLNAMNWIGVDVGGPTKRFDVAVIDEASLRDLRGRLTCNEVVGIVEKVQPNVVAIDSPCSYAPAEAKSRECERKLNKQICRIRWTPDATAVGASDYYGWIIEGLKLYAALDSSAANVIEVFPTASWTRWLGPRGSQRRSAWTREGLTKLGLNGVPNRTNQDQRDAIAAALTARQHAEGLTECFGEIVVPVDGL